MNKSLLLTTLATGLLLGTAPAVAPVQATSAIQRCQSSDGTLVYTDKSCAAFAAKAVPMPGELMTRIVREESRAQSVDAGDGAQATGGFADASMPLDAASDGRIAVGRRAPTGGCAQSPTQLAMDLRGSLALGDVNRVAESYNFAGMSNAQGQRILDRLQQLIGRQVVDTQYFDARIGAGSISGFADASTSASLDDAPSGKRGMLQLTLGNGAQASVTDFGVTKYAGCYFISY